MKYAFLAFLGLILAACGSAASPSPATLSPSFYRTPVPLSWLRADVPQPTLPVVLPELTPTPTPTPPTPTPKAAPLYFPPAADDGAHVRATRQPSNFGPQSTCLGLSISARHPDPMCPDLLTLVNQYDWPLEEALAVVLCESGGDAHALSTTGCQGLFQICSSDGGDGRYFDPWSNVSAAYAKYRDGVSKGNPWWHWNQFGACGWF